MARTTRAAKARIARRHALVKYPQHPLPRPGRANLARGRFHLVNARSNVGYHATVTGDHPRRAASSACGVSMSRNAPLPFHGHFRHRLVMPGDQVPRADIAVERHQFVEEPARPQHRIAAPVVADGHRDQIAAIRRKGFDQPVDQMGIDQRHVAKTDHRAVGVRGHRGDAGLDRAGEPAAKSGLRTNFTFEALPAPSRPRRPDGR